MNINSAIIYAIKMIIVIILANVFMVIGIKILHKNYDNHYVFSAVLSICVALALFIPLVICLI